MNLKPIMIAMLVPGLALTSGAAIAGGTETASNPIFGQASVQKMSALENKSVIGKGYYADLYGYYGTYYASVASQYGSLGYYYKSYSSYASAYSYATAASTYFYYAYYYQYYGA